MTEIMAERSMIPSMAILVTPDRSHITPQSAARQMGVARTRVLFIIPTRSIELPLAAQIKKAATKQKATKPDDQVIGAEAAGQLPAGQKDDDQ